MLYHEETFPGASICRNGFAEVYVGKGKHDLGELTR